MSGCGPWQRANRNGSSSPATYKPPFSSFIRSSTLPGRIRVVDRRRGKGLRDAIRKNRLGPEPDELAHECHYRRTEEGTKPNRQNHRNTHKALNRLLSVANSPDIERQVYMQDQDAIGVWWLWRSPSL